MFTVLFKKRIPHRWLLMAVVQKWRQSDEVCKQLQPGWLTNSYVGPSLYESSIECRILYHRIWHHLARICHFLDQTELLWRYRRYQNYLKLMSKLNPLIFFYYPLCTSKFPSIVFAHPPHFIFIFVLLSLSFSSLWWRLVLFRQDGILSK